MTEKELLEFPGNQPNNELNLPGLAIQVGSGTGIIPFVGAAVRANGDRRPYLDS